MGSERPLRIIIVDADRNPLENPDLFEGDIELEGDTDRSAVIYKSFLWSGGVIPYVFGKDLLIDPQIIYKAMKEIMSPTCLKFIPRTYQKDYIKLVPGNGCSTKVGHRGGEHSITLGKGCNTIGIVMHEIGHAIGFFHEHNRSDRHKFIRIIWENIKSGKDSQFQQRKEGTDLLLTPLDFDSLKLYG